MLLNMQLCCFAQHEIIRRGKMRAIKKVFIVLALAVFASSYLFAAKKDDPIAIKGIRPMGMGGAFTAVADDENAFFYNPAGIAQRTGFLLQIFNFNAAINSNTIDAGNDLSGVLNNLSDSESSVDDLIKIKDAIADRDIDIMLSLVNPAFISSPISAGEMGNTLSFGFGLFNSVSVGVRAGMFIPRFALEFVRLVTENVDYGNSFIDVIPDSMLSEPGILQPAATAADVRNAIAEGEDWSYISTNFLSAAFVSMIDDIIYIARSSRDDGDKYADIVALLNGFMGGIWNINNAYAKATVNAYATATLGIPFAYKFKSLDALRMPGELSIGANVKYIQRAKFSQTVEIKNNEIERLLNGYDIEDAIDTEVGAATGQGFGVDLGMMYSLSPRWHFGLQISDVMTNINYNRGISFSDNFTDDHFTHDAYIAAQFNIGASHIPQSILGWDTKNRLLLAADIRDIFGSYQNSFKNKLHVGAEYRLGCLALRTGLNKLRPAAGFGLEFNAFQLTYAYYGEESYLARMLGEPDKTVYYHEFLLAFKIGHNKGRKVSKDEKTSEKENKITSADENTATPEENQAIPDGESEKASEENNNNGE